MERFLAICHPLHLYTMSGFKRAVRIVAVLWIISFLSAVPFGVFSKIDYLVYPIGKAVKPIFIFKFNIFFFQQEMLLFQNQDFVQC